jgi:hypothetical protein
LEAIDLDLEGERVGAGGVVVGVGGLLGDVGGGLELDGVVWEDLLGSAGLDAAKVATALVIFLLLV